MSYRTKITAIAATFAAAAFTVTATATPALAWTPGPFTATLNGDVVIDAGIPATCTDSTLSGTVDSDGDLTITAAGVDGCGVQVTPTGLPWTGSIADGTAVFTGFTMSAIGCTYRGDLTGTYNATDIPGTASFTDQPATRTSGFLCPSSVTISAAYDFTQP
ncbi:hypothetical protein BJF79_01875 [Actinomadura sp. CNU-125]|uniref:hypothetical protein n=1 Tax=Actinomadura sp. CNU-125 TaxID=1904961 RepID=UPI0009593254|nr:hypothetical protein [Actinomadura sp. CNU-125]OLT23189.1 hypothetical protein BJF79_01875 [Actinomadura sp. CNU-125]